LLQTLMSRLAQHDLPAHACALESVSSLADVTVVSDANALAMLPQDTAQHDDSLGVVRALNLRFEARPPSVSRLRRRRSRRDARGNNNAQTPSVTLH
jgi:hypothetical protein